MTEEKKKKTVQKVTEPKFNKTIIDTTKNIVNELEKAGYTYDEYLKNPAFLTNVIKRNLVPVYVNELEKERL